MASQLNTKINSYSIEHGIEFDGAVNASIPQTGTLSPLTLSIINSTAITYESTVNPPFGSGSWLYNYVAATSAPRLTIPSGTFTTLADNDISFGLWIKFNSLPTGTGTNIIANTAPTGSTNPGWALYIAGSTRATNPSKLLLTLGSNSFVAISDTVVANNWYYIALTKEPGTTNNVKTYINGTLSGTFTQANTSASITSFNIGASTNPNASFTANYSNYYLASATVVGPTQIAAIYTAGTSSASTNITITETPATASALMTEPTIAVTVGDHTEITTSIIASIEFPSNIVAGGDRNVNNVADPMNSTSATIGDNVVISTGFDESFSAETMLASIEMTEPILPRQPMNATATMPNATVVISQNYYSLVKSLNPLFYSEFDSTSVSNQGSWQNVTYDIGSTVQKNVLSTGDLGLIGQGKSWKFTGTYNNAPNRIRIVPENPNQTIYNLERSREFSVEYWFKGTQSFKKAGAGLRFGSFDIGYLSQTNKMGCVIDYTLPAWYAPLDGIPGPAYSRYLLGPTDSVIYNDWNHVVLTVTKSQFLNEETGLLEDTADGFVAKLYVNANLVGNRGFTRRNWDPVNTDYFSFYESDADGVRVPGTGATGIIGAEGFWFVNDSLSESQTIFDQLAIYPAPLTNSQIAEHYYFVSTQSPDRQIFPDPMTASSASGNHNFVVTSNAIPEIKEATASATFVNPLAIAAQIIVVSAEPMTASATNTSATVYWGWTIYASALTSYAEEGPAYFLSDVYSRYIQTNIAPYRYVTFDASNSYADSGTDADYSVIPVTVGGTIVNPDFGINGKSAKTAGTNYATDGVILKESEWNDSWGTGENSYHSSFWFQRAADDNSTTGLRVLWNLNGYKDNQHVVLYQYQNKLHMQFNNGSGTHIEQSTANSINLFDYERHFIVVEFDHRNASNNTIRLYADAALVMTVDLGSYTGTTTNATSADSGANSETNNHPRLSVGCLITPFASTALPVVPSNTKLIIDEIYWDKNSIDQTMVTNIYNLMPDKNNTTILADSMIATGNLVNPTNSASVVKSVLGLEASADFADTTQVTDREVIYTSENMTASADAGQAKVFENIVMYPDIFLGSAIFNDAGVKITIPGGPMVASAKIVDDNFLVNGLERTKLSTYIRYLRIQNYYGRKIYQMREIK